MTSWSSMHPEREERPLPPLWRDGLFGLVLLLTLFAVAPFTLPGYFWGANDARHHIYFLFEYNRSLADGIWWPRWSPDFAFGYGYPFFNIYGPLSHSLAALLLRTLGLSYTAAIESVFGLSILGSAATMYLFIRSWWGRSAAVISALVYVYVPYHLLNLYVRANLAESMAFVWLPLCLWTGRQSVRQPAWRWVVGLALSYAGLMLTSNLVIVLFTPLLMLYLAILPLHEEDSPLPRVWPNRLLDYGRRALAPLLGGILGLGVSAIFWIPAFLERQFVRQDQWFDGRYDFRGNFVYFFQLFSPRWGFGTSEPGPDDPFGFQLGVAAVVLVVIGLYLVLPQLAPSERREIWVFVGAGAVATLLALQLGAPIWEWPLIGAIVQSAQFPWRWFNLTALCLSVLAGLIAHPLVERSAGRFTIALLSLIGVILLSSYPYLQVEIRPPVEGPVSLAALMRFQQSSDEMTGSTSTVTVIPTWSPMADHYINQEAAGRPVQPITTKVDYGNPVWPIDYETLAVHSMAHNTVMEELYFHNMRSGEQRVVFNHFYYPGWKAYLLDEAGGIPLRELPIIPEETGTLGRMTVPLPEGEGYLLLRFEDTPIRLLGQGISLASLALLALVGLFSFIRRRWRTHKPPGDG